MMDSGVRSTTSIILICVMLSAQHCLMKWDADSDLLSIKSQCYTNHKEGFYVYAKPNKCDPETVIKYIGRYLGRPVIATSRIDSYDEDSETVTFHYNRHEDDKYIQETIPALDFIRRLIRHIPEKHFKMIRYGGLYARHREIDKNLHLAISKAKRHTLARL